ncbi:hypothetical protein BGAL_0209g00050 [Botrytis galanthina]|uniref:Uncharacterized protein n=1 Tax=Botrytis galanthina TaxID=278940 RepID=A0A4V4HUE9_9HELO|nr:hypothetical protein BGAL_0209g00050 [Botrytis galanthina]
MQNKRIASFRPGRHSKWNKSPCATYSNATATEACFRSNDTAPPFLHFPSLLFLPILKEEMFVEDSGVDKQINTRNDIPATRIELYEIKEMNSALFVFLSRSLEEKIHVLSFLSTLIRTFLHASEIASSLLWGT